MKMAACEEEQHLGCDVRRLSMVLEPKRSHKALASMMLICWPVAPGVFDVDQDCQVVFARPRDWGKPCCQCASSCTRCVIHVADVMFWK